MSALLVAIAVLAAFGIGFVLGIAYAIREMTADAAERNARVRDYRRRMERGGDA